MDFNLPREELGAIQGKEKSFDLGRVQTLNPLFRLHCFSVNQVRRPGGGGYGYLQSLSVVICGKGATLYQGHNCKCNVVSHGIYITIWEVESWL